MQDNNTPIYRVSLANGKSKDYTEKEYRDLDIAGWLDQNHRGQYNVFKLSNAPADSVTKDQQYVVSITQNGQTKSKLYSGQEFMDLDMNGWLEANHSGNYQIQSVRGYSDASLAVNEDTWKKQAEQQKAALDKFDEDNKAFMQQHEADTLVYDAGEGVMVDNDKYRQDELKYQDLTNQRQALQSEYSNNPYIRSQYKAEAEYADQKAAEYEAEKNKRSRDDDDYRYFSQAKKLEKDAAKTWAVDVVQAPGENGFADYMSNYGKGAGKVFSDRDFWTRGISAISRDLNVRKIFKKLQDKGFNLNEITEKELDENLTPGEKALIYSFVRLADAQAARAKDMAPGYTAGQTAADSAGFMAEFFISGGLGKVAGSALKEGAQQGLRAFIGRALTTGSAEAIRSATSRGMINAFTKGGQRALTQGMKQAVKAGTAAATGVYKYGVRPMEEAAWHTALQLSTYRTIADDLTQIDNNGKLVEAGTAIWGGVLDSFIENWSESMGDFVNDVIGLPFKGAAGLGKKLLGETSLTQWGRWLADTTAAKVLTQAGFHGLIGEMGEEWLGNAARVGLSLMSGDEFKDFRDLHNQLDMAASFAPMSLFGLGSSSYAAAREAKNYRQTVEAFRGVLNRTEGMTQEEIANIFDTKHTKKEIADILTPVLQKIVHGRETNSTAFEDYITTLKMAQALSMHEVVSTAQSVEKNLARDEMRRQIETELGSTTDADGRGKFTHRMATDRLDENGNPYEVEAVTTVKDADGNEWFYMGDNGSQVVLKKRGEAGGKPMFLTQTEYEQKVESGEFTQKTQLASQFLDEQVQQKRTAERQARANQEIQDRYSALLKRFHSDPTINLGTEDAPLNGTVMSVGYDGVIVDFGQPVLLNGETLAIHKLSLEQAGNAVGLDTSMRSEEQRDADAVDRDEKARKRVASYNRTFSGKDFTINGDPYTYVKMFEAPFLDENGNEMVKVVATDAQGADVEVALPLADLESQALTQQEREQSDADIERTDEETSTDNSGSPKDFRGNDIPMRVNEKTGEEEVDKREFKKRDPEAYYKWNDSRRGGNTADSMEAIQADIAAKSKERETLAKQKSTETDPDVRDELEGQITRLDNEINLLSGIYHKYDAANNFQEQQKQYAEQFREIQQRLLHAKGQEQIEELQQKQRDLYLNYVMDTRDSKWNIALNEHAVELQKALNEIADLPVQVTTEARVEEDLINDGVDRKWIDRVIDKLATVQRERMATGANLAINGFHHKGKIYIFAEDNANVEDATVTYYHERQHNENRLHPEAQNAVLALANGNKDALYKTLETIIGNASQYSDSSATVLADEILAFTIEKAYTNSNYIEELKALGLNDELINIISTEYGRQQGTLQTGTSGSGTGVRPSNAPDGGQTNYRIDEQSDGRESGNEQLGRLRQGDAAADTESGEVNIGRESGSGQEQELQSIIEQAKADGTYMKAPNGKRSHLDERQWAQVRTDAFKSWFGDWEIAAKAKAIRELTAVSVAAHNLSRGELEKLYKGLPSVNKGNKTIRFYGSTFDKNFRENGLFAKAIPALSNALDNSILAFSEPDNRGGEIRPDGTVHKKHPNIESFDNYVGKVALEGKEYYVRFVVANEKEQSGVHSQFVTNIELYDNTAKSLSGLDSSLQSRGTYDGIIDAKLVQFFDNARVAEENSSKVVDENGEPLVMIHNSKTGGITEFKPGVADAIYFADKIAQKYVSGFERGDYNYDVFLNIRNPYTEAYEPAFIDEADGIDGVFYTEKTEDGDAHAAIVSDPKQILFADGGVRTSETAQALSPTGKTAEEVVNYSIVRKDEVDAASYDYWQSHKDTISEEIYSRGQQAMDEMAAQMRPYYGALAKGNRILPLEQYGGRDAKSTIFNNASYGRTIENTLKCMRTLAYNEFTDAVKEKLGRPLTQRESFLASQMVYDIATDPQCLYCYVSLDRKAYDDFLLKYIQQRDAILEKYRALPKKLKSIGSKAPNAALSSLYGEFLAGRKDTPQMKSRFNAWIRNEMDGTPAITTADLATKAVRNAILNGLDAKVAAQVADAEKYAQSASWAKKDVDYISYIGELLKMSPNVVHHLLEEYGLRFYSFSEFTPAFILENMQMVRDAALRGLNGLAYTKEIDFVKIFAPTGMNINISCYGRRDADGNFVMDSRQGADWEEAKKLREQYPNVAISFTVTSDEDVNWALEQDFVDVIIPFHIVRTGEDIANFYGWTNYSAKQADQINGTQKKKYISPVDHHNNKEHFLALCKEENITPRFVQFVEHPNYMRLVNETRRSIDETVPLQPVFDMASAQDCWGRFIEKGGYYNGWWQCTPEEYIAAVDRVVEDVKAGKEANQVDYGRQDIPINPERAAAAHRRARQHGNRPLYSGFKAEQQNESAEESNAEIRFREVSERKQWIEDYVNAVHLVTGKDKKVIRAELNERVAEAKEEARELYGNVLSGNFNSVTLQQIDNYIDNATNGNRFYRPLSQRLRERALLSLQGRGRTGEVDALFSRICESAVPANERTRAEGRRKIEARKEELLEGWAKATGNWHESIADFTSNTEPIGHGTDSEVYLSDDGESVIKASKGKFDNKKFPTDIDQVALFNSVFPRSAYTILGYGRVNGKFVKYLEQQLVDFNTSTPLSVEERVAYMRQLGYEPQNEDQTVFSNGDIVVSDLQKSNIVRDAAGNVRVIDADVKLHTKDIGGNYTYAPVEYDTDIDGNPQPLEANTESDEPGMEEASVEFRAVQDPALLDRLNNEETISVYQSAVKIGDNYYPPMSTLTEEDENGRPKLGQPVQFGTWIESEEHPERIAKSGRYKGRYPLREKGKTTWVAYNPYLHTTASPLNDQFTAAHKKPLVVLEVRVPKSELAGNYHAEGAKDSTGEMNWHSGPVSTELAKLGKERKVILTRWAEPVREVPAEEIADKVADMLDGTGIAIPINVVTPELRDALAERGVEFGPIRGTVGEEEKAMLQAELKRIKTLQKEARKKAAETDSGEQEENLLVEANADQKKAGGNYASPADLEQVMIEEAGNVSFRLSNNNRATIGKWLDKWSEARVDALMKRYGNGTTRESWVKTMEDSKVEILDYLDNIQDATTQLAWAKWFCAGTVQIGAEDMPKVRQAIKIAKAHKVDPLQFDSPMAIINQWPGEIKEDPINPDEVNTLHKAKTLPDGLVIYDVDESEESRKNMRNIINTHFGKDCSPWCLLQGTKEGKLTAQSKKYWNHYNVYPKQVVFKNGKLLAFSANDTSDRVWWDKQDKSHDGIPVIGKIKGDKLGRSGNIEYDPETGEQGEVTDIHKGDKQNGHYQQWLTLDAEHPWVDADYKDGKLEGKYITRYSSGAVQMEQSMADGLANGECTTYREDGSIWSHHVAKNGRVVGEDVSYHKDGTIESTIEYDENGRPTGNFRKYYSHGSLSSQGIRDGNTRTVQQFALDGTELLREVEQQGDNKIWHLTSKKRWDKDGKIEFEWDRIISPLNTAYKNYDITISTDHGTGGTYIREVTGGGTPSFKVYSEISNIDGVITLKAFRAYGAGINGHQINYTERYSEDGRLVLATKDVPYEAEDGSIKYNKIDYKPGEQDFSVDELYNDFYESKIHPDAEGGPRFSVRFSPSEIAAMETPILESKGTFKNLDEAEEWAKKNLQGKSEVNQFTNEDVSISGKSISEMLNPKSTKSVNEKVHLAALQSVLDFIRTGIPAEVHRDTHGRGFDVMRLYNAIVVDGEIYRVKSTIKKLREGDKYYTYEMQEMEIMSGTQSPAVGLDGFSRPQTHNSISGKELLKGVKKTNSNEEILTANVANNFENTTQSSENETTFRTDEETKEKKALQEKVTGWLTDENIEWAEGKELKDVIEHFGNTPEPIAVMPSVVRANVPSLESDYLYCGKAYLIDHQANHHPELGIDEYINIQTILDSYDDIKDLSDADNLKFAFVKKLDKGYAVVVELSKENNKIILHKTFFYRDSKNKRVPYKNKPSIFEKWSEDGSTSISPAENQQPADTENISALDTSSEGKDTNNFENATQSSENETTFRTDEEREQVVAEVNEGQKMADGNYVSPAELDEIRLRTVYHGSGAAFDRFDSSHMGEGEGAQAYGWGHYVTEVEGIGRAYAENLGSSVQYKGVRLPSTSRDVEISAASSILALQNRGNSFEEARAKFIESCDRLIAKTTNGSLKERLTAKREAAQGMEEEDFEKLETGHNLYTVEIPEDNGSNYFDYTAGVDTKENNRALLEKIKPYVEEDGIDTKSGMWAQLENTVEKNDVSPVYIIRQLAQIYGMEKGYSDSEAQKKQSEILSKLGYVGIKYPAEYQSGGREDGAKNYVIFNDEDLQITDRVSFRISNNNRKTINSWLDKWEIARYGSKEEAAEHREFVDAWIERIDNPTTQLAWAKWFCAGKIRLGQEDMPKVEQAVELAKKVKVDPLQFDSPMAIIEQFKGRIKEKPINPDTVPTLHRAKVLPDGLVTYDVDDTQESRENMRRIINTHFGKDCSPWCLLQGDGEGNLTKTSADYWNYYNAYPKQVVFKNGKLLAFSANNKKNRVWWDRMDASHKGIPITEKIPGDAIGRIGTIEINPSTGRRLGYYRNIHKGNKQNGKYEEWGQELAFETYYVTHFKDGVYDGLSARYYQAADGNWIIRSASYNKDGRALYVKKYLKGELLAKWLYEGDRLTYYDNGEFKYTRVYDNKNSLVELGEKSEDGFTYRSVEGSPIELSYEPGEQEKLRLVAALKSNDRVSAIYEDGGHRYTTDFRNWKDGELPADMLKEICEIHNVPGEHTMENLIKFCSEKADALLEEGAALEEKYKDLMPETTIRFRTVEITRKVREEMEVIEAKARVNDTYLQAPNGADTKLSAENWAFVRTDEFKNWFGDWELALKINNLVNIIKADKEHGFKNFAEAKEWAGKNIARLYTNNETGGKGDINISKKILDKFLSESSLRKSVDKDTHLAVLKVLPDIIREGIDAEQHPDIKKDENGERKLGNEINENVTIHRVYGAVEIGDTLHRVKITLKEDRTQGPTKRVYNYEATKIELLDGQSATPVGVPRNSNNSISVANLLNGVEKSYEKGKKLLDVSKIVDENGEPRVVYHQTNSTIWVNRKTGQNFDDLDWEGKNYWRREASQDEWEENWEEQDFYAFDNKQHGRTSSEMPAFFFSPKFDENHEYGDRTIAAFLNIKNPAVNPEIENVGRYDDAGEKAMQKLIEQGYDGFIREYDGEIDEINAFYPNQIKSATDYNGEVSSSENDIRLRMSEGSPIFGENGIEDEKTDFENKGENLEDEGNRDNRFATAGAHSGRDSAYDRLRGSAMEEEMVLADREVSNGAEGAKDSAAIRGSGAVRNAGRQETHLYRLSANPGTKTDIARVSEEEGRNGEKRSSLGAIRGSGGLLNAERHEVQAKSESGTNNTEGSGEDGRNGEKRSSLGTTQGNGEETLFRLIGEKAIKNLPEKESLRAQTNLEIAKQMKADGKSAQEILDATGWQFGKDDKPRFEEPDFKKSQVGTLVSYDGRTGMPLEGLIDDPRLFTEYPELKDWRIGAVQGDSDAGWTITEDKLIGIDVDNNLIKGEEFREADHPHAYRGRGNYPVYTFTLEGRKTLVHELQHAIQYIEGFAPGVSKEWLADMLRGKINDIQSDADMIKQAESDVRGTSKWQSYSNARKHNLDDKTIETRLAALEATPQAKKYESLVKEFLNKYHFSYTIWKHLNETMDEGGYEGDDRFEAMAEFLYISSSGEVESDVVEQRMTLSKAERRATLTTRDERVPRIVQWSLPAKQKDTADKAMQGLQFFDKEAMTDMLMKTFSDVPSEIRARITDKAPENGYNFSKASVGYFSGLAEREDELTAEEKEAVTTLRDNLKEALGIDILSLDDTLWSMFQTQTAGERDILTAARRAIVADRLGHTPAQEAKRKQAEDEIRYSIRRDMQSASEAEMYNRANSYAWNRLKESWVDMYESVNNLVEAVEIGTGRKAESFEDIRLALNQQSSKGLNAMQKYTSDYLEPMWEAIDSVMKTTGMTYEDVVRYVMLKHAVERNDVFARRDAKAFYKAAFDNAVNPLRQERKQLEKDRKKALADGDTQLATDCETRMQEIDLQIADEQKRLDRHYTMVDNGTAAKYRELRENDYGGLTSMFSDYPGLQPRNMYRTEEEYNQAAMAVRQPRYQSVAEMEAAALAEVDAFERRASGREFDNLWNRINAATKATLESQYRSNVISKEQYEAARDQFQYYVPLRGFKDTTAEDLWTYYNTELSGSFAPALIGAKGRKSEAGNPFNWIGTMASSAIAQNIKNESKLALYYFIANRPNQDLVTIQDVWYQFDYVETERYKQAHPGSTRKIFTAVYPPLTESLSSEAAKQVYDSWVQRMEQMAQEGNAYKRTNRLNVSEDVAFIDAKQEPQHVIRAKIRGKEVCLIINGSPRAAQAINGLLNVEADNDILQKVAGGFLRFLSAVNTSFNPEFWMSNMQRDLLFATMGSDIKGDGAGNFGSHLVTPAKLIKMAKAYKNNTLGNSQIENYYREFAEGGAITGYTVVNGNAYWEKKISEYIDKPVWRKAIEGIRLDKFLQYWQNLGEAVEQMARFAAYVTAREGGKDIAASVNAAKEISVNFNRKGSGKMITSEELKTLTTRSGRHLNGAEKAGVFLLSAIPWYGRKFIMFFNASVQALNAMYKLWKANPKKLLGKWATGYFAAGVMQAVLHALFDDDDDYLDIPDYTRRTNLLLGFGGVYFKWALPQEARVFYMLGDMMVNHIMGREPHKNLLGEAASAALELLPISVTDGLAGVTPSAARPFVELGQNKDFTGARIYNEMRYASDTEKKFTPRYKNALPNTGKMFINISQLLNTVSGGDKWDAGLVNIPPESIQHIVEGFGGGLLTTLNKVWETAGGAIDAAAGTKITGEELSVRRTPFLNRLLMVNDERTRNSHVTELFYYYKGEAERTKTKARQMKKEGDLEALDALQNSKDYEIYQIYKSYEKLMKKYDERIREETDPDEKKSLMRLQDEYRKEMINEISWLY